MNLLTKCLVSLLLLPVFSTALYAASLDYKTLISEHSGSIRTVITCGEWSDNDQNGVYRIVEAYLYDGSFLYVQRMAGNQTTGGMVVVSTQLVSPFDDDHSFRELSKIQCRSTSNGSRVTAISCFGAGDGDCKKESVEIILPADSRLVKANVSGL